MIVFVTELWPFWTSVETTMWILQERSLTAVHGKAAAGSSPAPMNWRVTTGSTRARNRMSACCVTGPSPARTTWPFTWRDMSDHSKPHIEVFTHFTDNDRLNSHSQVITSWKSSTFHLTYVSVGVFALYHTYSHFKDLQQLSCF